MDAAAVRPFIEKGFNLVAVGIDTVFLSRAAGDVLSELTHRETR
jgi:2-keto-3-deoxy-L-rhamnonate aldolase RhmA